MKQTSYERYHRQMLIPEIGQKGQEKLSQSTMVIIGAGGLGSNTANILVRTGVGTIKIIDDDLVALTNLHRTTIFTEDDVGKPKSRVLEETLRRINTDVTIYGVKQRITQDTIESLVKDADIIIDGTDNMETRFLINDVSIKHKIPWVYAGVYGAVGMVMGILPKRTPCLCCLSPHVFYQPVGDTPVLSNLPVTTASIQCSEALKIILREQSSGLLIYDTWKQCFEQIAIRRNPDCSCCGKNIFKFLERKP